MIALLEHLRFGGQARPEARALLKSALLSGSLDRAPEKGRDERTCRERYSMGRLSPHESSSYKKRAAKKPWHGVMEFRTGHSRADCLEKISKPAARRQ